MAKQSAGQKRRQKELKRRKQLRAKKQPTRVIYEGTPLGLPKLSEQLLEFAGNLLDGPQTDCNYVENTIGMLAMCWNIGCVSEDKAQQLRAELSKTFSDDQSGGLPEEAEEQFDFLITARRLFYKNDPRLIVNYEVRWDEVGDYHVQVLSTILPESERFASASGENIGAGLSEKAQKGLAKFEMPLTEEEVRLEELINHGFELLGSNAATENIVAACDVWLEAWELVKEIYQDKTSLDGIDNKMSALLKVWSADMDMHLSNAAYDDPSFKEKGITYLREFLEHFPDENASMHQVYRRAIAELQFRMGAQKEGDATFEALLREFPDDTWGYIGWGDIYNPTYSRPSQNIPADIDRARELYRMPIAKDLKHAEDARERLMELSDYREEAAALLDG